ncbi:hypothetical protein SGLAD_v1c07330 [Spiroplasma gladiatoris]|uniref:Uncharacterized protein n=1 Tax=Spiroplasma gladiatoris TaxID=2143 RepID=A0A4P7AI57_9MOLU|nr:hypothetical protein [Spiroplasma gladiatoris]QBQ07932.1 hypothetical protein SGLAD_v1c07330 [Spiroplasma gladiatoris]
MDDIQNLLKKIKSLEAEIKDYKLKDDYIKNGVERTTKLFEIANHNAQKIIVKSVEVAYGIKDEMQKCLNQIKENPNNYQEIVEKFLFDNGEIFSYNKKEIEDIAKKIVEDMGK